MYIVMDDHIKWSVGKRLQNKYYFVATTRNYLGLSKDSKVSLESCRDFEKTLRTI